MPNNARLAASLTRQPQVCEEVPAETDRAVPGLAERPAALLVPRLLALMARCVLPQRLAAARRLSRRRPCSPHVHLRKRAMEWCAAAAAHAITPSIPPHVPGRAA